MNSIIASANSRLQAIPVWLQTVNRMRSHQLGTFDDALQRYHALPAVVKQQKLKDTFIQHVNNCKARKLTSFVINDDICCFSTFYYCGNRFYPDYNSCINVITHRETPQSPVKYSVIASIPENAYFTEGKGIFLTLRGMLSECIASSPGSRDSLFVITHKQPTLPSGILMRGERAYLGDINHMMQLVKETPKKRLYSDFSPYFYSGARESDPVLYLPSLDDCL